jgi:hypothetical protein
MRTRHRPGRLARCTSNTIGFRLSGHFLWRGDSHARSVRHSLRARTCLALLLLAIVLALTGCDSFFDLLVENHTDQELTVQLTVSVGEAERRVRPCSVYFTGSFASRPGERVEVNVLDRDGDSLYSARVLPEEKGKALPQIYVRMPSEGSGDCPLPVSGGYVVKVKNYQKKDAFVFLDDVELGLVEASSTQTFGPLPGAWEG